MNELCNQIFGFNFLSGISRLKGTTLYELYLTHQQRGLNWKKPTIASPSGKSNKDVLSAFKVNLFNEICTSSEVLILQVLQFHLYHKIYFLIFLDSRKTSLTMY